MTEPTDAAMVPCDFCGMPCTPNEYHPYAACLMFKACHNPDTVRANLEAVYGTPALVGVEPVAWRIRHRSDAGMIGHYPWSFTDRIRGGEQPQYEYEPLYTAEVLAMGRVPLPEARRLFDAGWKAAARFCDRDDVVADGVIGFGACPQFEAAFKAAIAAQQGDTK